MTDRDSLAGEPEEYRRCVQLGEPEPVAAERYDGEENCFFTYWRYTADYRVKKHEILGVQSDAPEEIVKSAFRAQVQHFNGHPDTGGSQERFQQLKAAREAMLDE